MTALETLFVFCQALGALTGAFIAVWGELAYIRAARAGKIDAAKRVHLRIIAHGLRFGMTLTLLSSFGLVILAHLSRNALAPALTAGYWIFTVLALLIIVLSWALSRGRISFALGSAATLSAWWLLAYITLGELPRFSFGAGIAFYIITTGVLYAILYYAHFLLVGPSRS